RIGLQRTAECREDRESYVARHGETSIAAVLKYTRQRKLRAYGGRVFPSGRRHSASAHRRRGRCPSSPPVARARRVLFVDRQMVFFTPRSARPVPARSR